MQFQSRFWMLSALELVRSGCKTKLWFIEYALPGSSFVPFSFLASAAAAAGSQNYALFTSEKGVIWFDAFRPAARESERERKNNNLPLSVFCTWVSNSKLLLVMNRVGNSNPSVLLCIALHVHFVPFFASPTDDVLIGVLLATAVQYFSGISDVWLLPREIWALLSVTAAV